MVFKFSTIDLSKDVDASALLSPPTSPSSSSTACFPLGKGFTRAVAAAGRAAGGAFTAPVNGISRWRSKKSSGGINLQPLGPQRKYLQGLCAEKLEEELEKVKDQLDKVLEELRSARTQKSQQVGDRFTETNRSRKELELKMIEAAEMLRTFRQERELLQIGLDNALQKAEEVSRRKGNSSSTEYFSELSMTEIKEASQNFKQSLKIGEGGWGSVYRGFLRHTPVAIKIMKFPSMQGLQEFQREVNVLSKLRHPNLITLIGACPEPCTLVYEYSPNGSLEDWLRNSNRAKQLPWRARIRIATELCSVLAFLHSCKPHSIVHGDVKPGNILLDRHLVSKLSDFGICRLLPWGEQSSNNNTVVYPTDPKGTFGYMDPEFLVTRELTTKFDVYSFGIILLELLTRRPTLGIAKEVRRAVSAGTLEDILDPLAGEWPYMVAKELTDLALRCCEMSRRNRPDLQSDVWTTLLSLFTFNFCKEEFLPLLPYLTHVDLAGIDRIITLPEFGVPAIMPSFEGATSEQATPESEDKIYVAVGEDVEEGKAKLIWTVNQPRGNSRICIIHVLVPSKTITMVELGAGMPVSSVNEIVLRDHEEKERIKMQEILHTYLRFCEQMGVQAEKEHAKSDSVEKGIVKLIRSHKIRNLVMGAAAESRYFREMTEIKSRKAKFVHKEADISCQIRFICNGLLIHTREAWEFQAVAPSPTTLTPGGGKWKLSKSQSARLQRSGTAKLSNPIQDILRRVVSSRADRRVVMPIASPSPDSTPHGLPTAASMLERQDTFREREPFSTSLFHGPQRNQSVFCTGHSSLSDTLDMNENNAREVLEEGAMTGAEAEVDVVEGERKDTRKLKEELEKVKDQRDKAREDLRIAQDQKAQLELKIISMEQMFKQERELRQIELDNALQKAEEESRRQGDSSGTKFFHEFSMTEIKEAVWNFEPSLKIGEGACGNVYRGFLRNTPVAIKIIKLHSMHSSQEFQQEVDVLSKVRHPYLITLIGACPEPWTLVYEYFPNGSLQDWLRSHNRAKQLSWLIGINIAMELCSVLAFLHSCKPHSIVHGDVKPGNILLDANLRCKLSDFGICRLLSRGERSSNNTTVLYPTEAKGTPAYMDPEFFVTQELTKKFDVYSFGIILLELLTRRSALGIVNEVQKAINAGTLKDILDPLAGEWPHLVAEELTDLALRCCEMSRRNRSDLGSHVWTVLQSIGASCR
ncbi:U-box domain-containing protein 33-like [Rhodamnia argentea]|uniref:RING-type E3 ubiquitin transferase n=1 Tax=Rhodamnia argentea TaxID=178133 RepID=A0ABM3H4T3_9MYRT|nr:U-box domain-containing protein 33-like [Rhodamnia argentea]